MLRHRVGRYCMYTTHDSAHSVRHQLAYGLCAGVQLFLPREDCRVNGSRNRVHQVKHLLAKCKQTEMGSSPTTKNNPVAQQLQGISRKRLQAQQSNPESKSVSNNFSTCTDLFLRRESAARRSACGNTVYDIGT